MLGMSVLLVMFALSEPLGMLVMFALSEPLGMLVPISIMLKAGSYGMQERSRNQGSSFFEMFESKERVSFLGWHLCISCR